MIFEIFFKPTLTSKLRSLTRGNAVAVIVDHIKGGNMKGLRDNRDKLGHSFTHQQ